MSFDRSLSQKRVIKSSQLITEDANLKETSFKMEKYQSVIRNFIRKLQQYKSTEKQRSQVDQLRL